MASFTLQSIQYTTLTRMTLNFSDTVSPTAPANTNPSNYIINGGINLVGNFAISGFTISFDIALAQAGKIYDITINNIQAASGDIIASPNNRLPFYFGIGVITPMQAGPALPLGTLYIISDSALVGPIQPNTAVTTAFGTSVGQSVIPSYNELISQVPPGGFYLVDLVNIPYATGTTNFLFVSSTPDILFGFYVNNIFQGSSVSNYLGWVGFQIRIPVGVSQIQIYSSLSPTPYSAELVANNYTSWLAGITDSLGQIQASITQVQESMSIENVTSGDIQSNFGQFYQTPLVPNYSTETYRALLIEIIQAFRYFSGNLEALYEVIAAFTQVRPIIQWNRTQTNRWVLGWQHLLNREMTERFRYASSSFPSTNITAIAASDSNENGTSHLLFDHVTQTLQYESMDDFGYGAPVPVTPNGTFTIYSLDGNDSVTVTTGNPLPSGSVTIPVTITGPVDPNNISISNATYRILTGALMQRSGERIELTATASNPEIVLKADPTFFEHLGDLAVGSAWVYQNTGSNRTFVIEFSIDGGSTYIAGAPSITVPSGAYTRVTNSMSLGYFGITQVNVRLRGTDVNSGESFYIEKACLFLPQTDGLYLGTNTYARSRRRKFFGYKILLFVPEAIEQQAYNILGYQPSLGWGLDPWGDSPYGSPSYGFLRPLTQNAESTAPAGLIPYVCPTITENIVFQDSVFSMSLDKVVNVVGVIYEEDWRAGTLTNMNVVPLVPDRFTYINPANPSDVTETIIFNGSGIATLNQTSLQNQDQSRLLENGIPIPNDEWEYISGTQIQLLNMDDLDQTAVYTFSYTIELAFTSAVIDLGTNYALFNWYADWYDYQRMNLVTVENTTSQQINISSVTLLGNLPSQANTTASGTVLYQNNAGLVTPVSTTLWNFQNNTTIQLAPSAFNPNFIYTLAYTEENLVKMVVPSVVVQVMYSVDNITWNGPVTIPHDAPFGNGFRYFQFTASITNVADVRDYKLRSLVLKGDPLDRATIQSLIT